MEFIFFLIVASFIYKKVKKAAGIQKKLTDFNSDDYKKLQTQGTTDLQALLDKLDNYNELTKTKKSEHIHSDSDYNNKNYVTKPPKKPWSNSVSSKHVHSGSNYNNKNYVQDKPRPLEISNEKTVKRSMFDNRDTEPTIMRKDYD